MLEEPSLDIENLDTSLAPEEVGHLAAKHYRDQFTIQNFNRMVLLCTSTYIKVKSLLIND